MTKQRGSSVTFVENYKKGDKQKLDAVLKRNIILVYRPFM